MQKSWLVQILTHSVHQITQSGQEYRKLCCMCKVWQLSTTWFGIVTWGWEPMVLDEHVSRVTQLMHSSEDSPTYPVLDREQRAVCNSDGSPSVGIIWLQTKMEVIEELYHLIITITAPPSPMTDLLSVVVYQVNNSVGQSRSHVNLPLPPLKQQMYCTHDCPLPDPTPWMRISTNLSSLLTWHYRFHWLDSVTWTLPTNFAMDI